ncbi:Gfo/Idh/MocA family oxidoreductase [Bryobacter aggregatus]|uniref:Gfo/Idh/MocA family oxidoreductase n=1 Tax=Bryobacter aggregatus TaxID=360054 RepID=UPI00068E75BE|nr:Gfo/Idh/MocA family oxidoreductase [Bryobacter aggregatus]
MSSQINRRFFFYGPLLAGAVPASGYSSVASLKMLGYKSPNEKLNIAGIGAGGKGNSDLNGCASENIVALCDVDEKRAAVKFKQYEKAPKFKDYRKMLDEVGKDIDAVTVSVPDHMHAVVSIAAMERGKHVYCQKPLTRTVWEARQMMETANKHKVATQMGNQGYSNEGTRQVAEIVWSGEIGQVKEVHAWTDRPWWPQGTTVIPPPDEVPSTLEWDLWLGSAEKRPYTSGGKDFKSPYGGFYQPFNWRGFFDFGCGALGDMACHILGAPNMALKLGSPVSVECIKKEGTSSFQFPKKSVTRFDFAARGNMGPVSIFWYDGMEASPKIDGVPSGEWLGDLPNKPRPQGQAQGPQREPAYNGMVGRVFNYEAYKELKATPDLRQASPNGSLFVGDKGMLTTGTYGENTRLLPTDKMADYHMPEPLLTRSPGHYRDWIRACKGGDSACSNFNVAAPFVEWMLLGVIALRVDGKLEWDAAKMRFTNNNEANQYLKPKLRKGFTIG